MPPKEDALKNQIAVILREMGVADAKPPAPKKGDKNYRNPLHRVKEKLKRQLARIEKIDDKLSVEREKMREYTLKQLEDVELKLFQEKELRKIERINECQKRLTELQENITEQCYDKSEYNKIHIPKTLVSFD